ncbi:unnamed protein product, partial [Brassica rapa subsp. narinosa]
ADVILWQKTLPLFFTSINGSLNDAFFYIHIFAKDIPFASFRFEHVSIYIRKFQISYPFIYSIIVIQLFMH